MTERHLVVVSVDAMVYEDVALLSKLQTMQPLWHKTARVDRVQSIYPTITYPCHTTMITGVYPDKHGIVNNTTPAPGQKSAQWQFFRSAARGSNLFEAAKAHGLTTASVFWPVTGKDAAIDYLIDEYWPQQGESSEQCFRDSGSSEEVIEKIIRPNLKLL